MQTPHGKDPGRPAGESNPGPPHALLSTRSVASVGFGAEFVTNKPTGFGVELAILDMETMEQKLNEELKQLQREIEVCEAEQDSYVRSISLQHGEALRGVLQTLYNKKEKGDEHLKKDVSKLVTDITDTEKDIRRQTKISGITLTECCVKTLEKNERKTIQQYRLTGHCCFLSFQVEFALVDIQDSDSSLQKITDLNVILDGAEFKDLCAFVSRVEETKSLFLFFRTLSLFSERCKQRSCTLQYFKEWKFISGQCLLPAENSEGESFLSPKHSTGTVCSQPAHKSI
ncbi:hypothetical protein SRHO_G00273150 [Serrasalmus rhombeus]